METLSRTLRELREHQEAEIPSTAAGGAKNTAHKGLSNVYSNHELDGGQNTLIVCPNTQKTLIETLAASLGKEQGWKKRPVEGVMSKQN